MSFSGTIPVELRLTVQETVDQWSDVDLLFPCCGALTSERVIHSSWPDRFQLHSSDVNLVSCMLGSVAAGGDYPVELQEDKKERLGWLEESMTTPLDRATTVWLAFRYCAHLARDGWVHDRYLGGLRAQWPRMFEETRRRIENALPKLHRFDPADALDWLAKEPAMPVVTYPPFRGAARSYEVGDWKMMGQVFSWTEPPATPLQGDRYEEYVRLVTDRECWLLGVNQERPELAERLVMRHKPTNRAPTINVYASHGKLRLLRPRQHTAAAPWPHLLPGQEIGEKIALARLDFAEFAALRSQYMNRGIRPGTPDLSFAVLVDGVLIGAFAYIRNVKGVSLKPPWHAMDIGYLMSDFPVAPTDYPRLSRLILMAALSEDARLLCERILRRRFQAVLTTAFTNNPSSMKYRGEMTLYSRKEQEFRKQLEDWVQDQIPEWNSYYRRKWDLNYIARWGGRTLEEAYAEWQRKHAERKAGSGRMPATADR